MSDIVISVENLSKSYLVGHQSAQRERYTALRDVIGREARNFGRKAVDFICGRQIVQGDEIEEFWALRGVNFEVKRGEVLGIVGRNGAGKSTLLKILSRITEPTEGRITLRGRVASLLEVGTGFHPELTGRENIFLNGAILGMTRQEVRRKFDEIVEFAEIVRFLDTPVKRYSSGMYVRLAFAVAAHLEPEILVIDEVLAVGDTEFQKKCLGKMKDVATGGRTVLFVSHHMRSVQALCSRAILLENGQVFLSGTVQNCIERYSEGGKLSHDGYANLKQFDRSHRRGSGECRFESFELLNREGMRSGTFAFGEPFKVRIAIRSVADVHGVTFGFSILGNDGVEIMGTTAHDGGIVGDLRCGINEFECDVSPMILTPGRYAIRAAIFRPGESLDHIDEILSFEISDAPSEGTQVPRGHYVGSVYMAYNWKHSS